MANKLIKSLLSEEDYNTVIDKSKDDIPITPQFISGKTNLVYSYKNAHLHLGLNYINEILKKPNNNQCVEIVNSNDSKVEKILKTALYNDQTNVLLFNALALVKSK